MVNNNNSPIAGRVWDFNENIDARVDGLL